MTLEEIVNILVNHRDYEWQVQGFGMLRTYLGGSGEPRLQVWDQRLASWGNNAIHDHPWAFESTIFLGTIFNQRYTLEESMWEGSKEAYWTLIKPGVRGGKLSASPVERCALYREALEIYSMGDVYQQTHRELHITRYLPGTVTLITRTDREEADVATIAWFGSKVDQPVFVNPYPATPELTELIITDALAQWRLK